jgi:tetratricopeptide (TPR) repeat protein
LGETCVAESLLGGILAGEDEIHEVEAPEPLASAEAFASAVAARLAGNDPGVARRTEDFLIEQTELLKVQKKHILDEHALRISHLRNQLNEETVRRFGLRLRVGFQLFLTVITMAVAAGAVIMIHDAVTSRSVVIDSIEVAPNIAAEAPSGRIVAAGLLDVLTRIQAATRSGAEHRALSNAWTSDIEIEVPETGVSVGQIERLLKARFGHDQHIDGDLVQTKGGGFALTVRGTGILPKVFIDEERNLDVLLTDAGEYVYGQSEPGLWAAYLSNNNRYDDAIRFAQAAYGTADLSERPYLLNYWANAISGKSGEGTQLETLPLYREAVRLKPDYWIGYNNIMYALFGLGDEEGVVRVGTQLIKVAGGRPGRVPEIYYQNYDQALWNLPAERASEIADIDSHSGIGTTGFASGAESLGVAELEVQMHDVEAATLRLKTTPVDDTVAPDVAQAAIDRALVAEEVGDFNAAAQEWDILASAYSNPTVSTSNPQVTCFAAMTYERTGQPAKADAALNAVGKLTYVDCYRFRADVLDMRGDWAGAQEWYAKAVKLGPSIPSGYYSWGVALARHGDLGGAAAKLADASQRGPHWADPLKAWGDVLMKQGHPAEALVKYGAALKYAPNWAALKAARATAAKQTL